MRYCFIFLRQCHHIEALFLGSRIHASQGDWGSLIKYAAKRYGTNDVRPINCALSVGSHNSPMMIRFSFNLRFYCVGKIKLNGRSAMTCLRHLGNRRALRGLTTTSHLFSVQRKKTAFSVREDVSSTCITTESKTLFLLDLHLPRLL